MEERELVKVFDGKPTTTTLILAEGTANQHASVIRMTRKYADDLEEFGTLRFEIRKSGGPPTEFAYLNEPQSTLLLTYMSNTPIIREFKKRLVAAFIELSAGRQLAIQNNSQNQVHTKVTVNTGDLVREANKGNRFAQRLLHHLTGMKVDDISAEIEQRQVVEDFRRAELAAQYFDLLLKAQDKMGIVEGFTDKDAPYLQGTTTQFHNVFKALGKKYQLPMLAKEVHTLGTVLSKETSGLEFYGWHRSVGRVLRGVRYFRFEKIVEVLA